MADYPYDDDALDYVAQLLYQALPALYRVRDQPPEGAGELEALLRVLAAPGAVIRQSIEELHADLFIDTAADRIVPYLAEMVGTTLVFPDADSNRLDVRGTVAWRRRKGTPTALQEMTGELTNQAVVTQEGWKRLQLAQDLDLLRPERTTPDLRPAVVAEQATGPLDSLAHAADIRSISASTGRYHPRHLTHWLQPTVTFPLTGATPVDRSVPGHDRRFAMDPLGVRRALRARRVDPGLGPFVDRIRELHFAACPGDWFGRPGGFTIRVCGLPAAIAAPEPGERVPAVQVADPLLGQGRATLSVLEQPSRGFRGGVLVELGLAPVTTGSTAGTWRYDAGGFAVRASVELDASGAGASVPRGGPAPGGARVPMLRLAPVGGASGRFFPGATIEIAGDAPAAAAAAADPELAREGFLRGAVHVRVPPLEVVGERFLYLAADGSLYEAGPRGQALDMPRDGAALRLAASALSTPGPGPAWPPLAPQAEPSMFSRVPAAPGCGPAVLHGATPLRRVDGGLAAVPATAKCALAFALQSQVPGGAAYRPFQRLAWTGPDPAGGVWSALDPDGSDADAVSPVYADIAARRDQDPDNTALAVRFECSEPGATLCPGEVAWTSDDGHTVLVHLPQLDAELLAVAPAWSAPPPYTEASEPVRVALDGSTWAAESAANRRVSLGAVAPVAQAAALRRRTVGWRRLCAWDNEDWTASPPQVLPPTRRGRLDIDVAHGLFAFSDDEPPQPWAADVSGGQPPVSVTTDYEEGATAHLGARPTTREPVLDLRLPRPTRLVSASGRLHDGAPADWHLIPRYRSLTDALAAVAATWTTLTSDGFENFAAVDTVTVGEVIQFEDSATYRDEAPTWPAAPADPAVLAKAELALTIQAAERERPVVLLDPAAGWSTPTPAPAYASITLRGLALGGQGWNGTTLPPSAAVAIQLCTVLFAENELEFADVEDGAQVTVTRCETAGLTLAGSGVLAVADSIVDAAAAEAVQAMGGYVTLDRVSVGGSVRARALEASEVIFEDPVTVEDRFEGCVRYSRVAVDSTLPRVHRVTTGTPVRIVSRNRRDPAWWRLRADCPRAVSRGAETGSEMGAFNQTHLAERIAALERRLAEYTPAGLVTGIIRID